MASVAGDFARAIGAAAIGDPRVPIVANVTAEPVRDAAAIREELARQLTSSVRWADSVARLLDAGVRTFYEIGPGNVLTGLVRRIAKHAGVDVRAVSLDQPEGLEAAKEAT
jgi:[acyl-carrier-protein] S-malonyltransferase